MGLDMGEKDLKIGQDMATKEMNLDHELVLGIGQVCKEDLTTE